jgi:acetoin utilization protein AcuB
VGRVTRSGVTNRSYTERVLVAEWMTRDPIVVGPDDTLGTAAETMARRNIRRMPVVEDGVVAGIITKSDVLNACPADFNPFSAEAIGTNPLTVPVRQVMSAHPRTVRPDAPIEAAAKLMIDHKIGGLPVVADRLVGILTESDLFRALTAALGAEGAGLRITFDLSQGEDPVRFAVDLASRHGLRLASISTHSRDGQRMAIVRLLGTEPPGLVDDLWKTGHRVLSVLRLT